MLVFFISVSATTAFLALLHALIEIKSSKLVHDEQLANLRNFKKAFKKADLYCWCNESIPRISEGVQIVPWMQGLREVGL